ncbi:glutathione-disulfide reductase [Variovorax humicola]|uniref:Glutathione-disulfide reductase n=1 Tax=Variovorax humicola TaxID=1769758 RepID=A0ABU8WC10_9BURK
MVDDSYDLVVVGGGSGGVRAGRLAASLGARVALVEEHRVGGTCVVRGCVPKKLVVLASRFANDFEDAKGFGWNVSTATFHWGRLVDAVDGELGRLEGLYRRGLENAGVAILDDRGVLEGPGVVRLQRSGALLRCKHVLLATGSTPASLDIPGGEFCVTSDHVFSLARQPKRMVVLGGGYIAVEIASALNSLGTEITILHRAPALLRGFDEMLQEGLTSGLSEAGIRMHPGAVATSIERTSDGLVVHDSTGGSHRVDCVLNATGRRPQTRDLGLDSAGVEVEVGGAIKVDDRHQTTAAGVFAVGDVTNQLNLTPVAIRQGQEVAQALFGNDRRVPIRFDVAPTAVFSTPELGTVGVTESVARQRYANVKVFETQFRPMRATLAKSKECVAMKVLVCGDTDKVVGVHLLGREAAEMIQLIAIALQLGATKHDLDQTLAVHPTAAEELVTLRTAS